MWGRKVIDLSIFLQSVSFLSLLRSFWIPGCFSPPNKFQPMWFTSHPVELLCGQPLAFTPDSLVSSRLPAGRAGAEMNGKGPRRAWGTAWGLGRQHGSKKGWGRCRAAVRRQMESHIITGLSLRHAVLKCRILISLRGWNLKSFLNPGGPKSR